MTFLDAAILGTIQGLTEFLPISSSGHLALAEYFLDVHTDSLLFEVVLHLATLVAVIVFFWSDLIKITRRQILILGIGTIPAVIVGLTIKDYLETVLSSLPMLTIQFLISAGLMVWAHYLTEKI